MSDTNPAPEVDVIAAIKDLQKNAEAAKALVYAAIVEEWLQKLLLHGMRQLSNAQAKRMFDGYGPLNSFAGKCDIAFGFKLISEETYDDLRVIKDIRNRFAHASEHISFESEEIATQCHRFKSWKKGVDNHAIFLAHVINCASEMQKRIETSILVEALRKRGEAHAAQTGGGGGGSEPC